MDSEWKFKSILSLGILEKSIKSRLYAYYFNIKIVIFVVLPILIYLTYYLFMNLKYDVIFIWSVGIVATCYILLFKVKKGSLVKYKQECMLNGGNESSCDIKICDDGIFINKNSSKTTSNFSYSDVNNIVQYDNHLILCLKNKYEIGFDINELDVNSRRKLSDYLLSKCIKIKKKKILKFNNIGLIILCIFTTLCYFIPFMYLFKYIF